MNLVLPVPMILMKNRILMVPHNIRYLHCHLIKMERTIIIFSSSNLLAKLNNILNCRALSMGMLKTYSLFKINQNNNVDEIHNCGKQEMHISID